MSAKRGQPQLTNGTYLNDAKLCSATRVRSGDRLSFGGLQLAFEEP
jgi:hypothetical protein